ncbi:hypothetical protein ACK280_27320 [Mycobacterium sherrisii]|uniref:hypothetical protein n=1 Tax=Mycobacterium sherrisii TaxID=243061 RepID=UPI003976568D
MMDTVTGASPAEEELAEAVRHYNFWREVARAAGQTSPDEPDWQDGRLYFRSDYSAKLKKWPDWVESGDWAAWIIAPNTADYACVLKSRAPERSAERIERVEMMFSRNADAGKAVVLKMGDGIRSALQLKTVFVEWRDRGLSSHIQVEPADRPAVDFLKRATPTLKLGYAEQYLKRYTRKDGPDAYGYAMPSEEPRMQVLALSFEELTSALLEGMPGSVTANLDTRPH